MKALSSVLAHVAISKNSLLMITAANSVGIRMAGEPALAPVQCLASAGQSAQETDQNALNDKDIPIDHIIVILQENRSFDHYFQGLPGSGQTDADVAPLDVVNVDRKGNKLSLQLAESPCTDGPRHSWNSVHQQIAGGKMDDFAANGGQTSMLHYDDTMLAYCYALANHFAIAEMILISPYAKQNHVSHVVHDHTSILRFVQARFNLPAMSARDANAQIPFDLFDFNGPPRMTRPQLPRAIIDPAFIGRCQDTKTTNFEDEVPVAGSD